MGERIEVDLRIKGPELGLVVTRTLWSDQITNNVHYVDVYINCFDHAIHPTKNELCL